MDAAEAGEARILEAGDGAEDLGLRAVLHLGLEADEVVEGAERVVAAELDDGVGFLVGGVRVGEADGLQRAEAEGLAAALGHDLDGEAALEIGGVALPVLELGLLGGEQRVDEGLVLGAVHGAVEVGGALGLGLALVVAGLEPGLGEVDGVEVHDRGDGVEEGERGLSVRVRMAAARAGEVSGPVATMTLDHAAGGRPATSARSMVTRGWASRRAVISAEKGTRSMASALPAGTAWRSAAAMTRPWAARISQWRRPTAFCSSSSERKEFDRRARRARRSGGRGCPWSGASRAG